ncbi:hypothetical protein ACIA5G_06010 [Amycolatopsis sp. NPDC051758]|uniref:hypothetical protein n=1 Tax=Amycolatopsis sp. NPDC051758 TaxID=3363935 RepID=UPI00379749B3
MVATTAVDLRGDFDGFCDLTLPEPTPEGRCFFTLISEVIDTDTESFFGRGFCHWLAGAVHSITGWDLLTVDVRWTGEDTWHPAHSGALTPAGTVLDIFGDHDPEDVRRRYLTDDVAETRTRVVHSPDMPGDVITDIDDRRGDPLWWTDTFDTPDMQNVVLHFARLILTRHGHGDHIDPAARPGSAHLPVPQPKSGTPTSAPDPKGTVMSSIPEEVARLNVVLQAIPTATLQALSETELPAEVRGCRDVMSGLGSEVLGILGNTASASQAAQSLGHAIAMLERANETQQILKMHYGKALRSAVRAHTLIQAAIIHHGQGAR